MINENNFDSRTQKSISPEDFSSSIKLHMAEDSSIEELKAAINNHENIYIVITSEYEIYLSTKHYPHVDLKEGIQGTVLKWINDEAQGIAEHFANALNLPKDNLKTYLDIIKLSILDFTKNPHKNIYIN